MYLDMDRSCTFLSDEHHQDNPFLHLRLVVILLYWRTSNLRHKLQNIRTNYHKTTICNQLDIAFKIASMYDAFHTILQEQGSKYQLKVQLFIKNKYLGMDVHYIPLVQCLFQSNHDHRFVSFPLLFFSASCFLLHTNLNILTIPPKLTMCNPLSISIQVYD